MDKALDNTINWSETAVDDNNLAQKLAAHVKHTEIKALDISSTFVSSLYCFTKLTLTSLEELDISLTGITDWRPLKRLKGLKCLYANQNTIDNPDCLSALVTLEKLSLEYLHTSFDLSHLAELVNLKVLSLMGNEWVKDLSPLAKLPHLNKLYIQGTGIFRADQLAVFGNKQFTHLAVNDCLSSAASLYMGQQPEPQSPLVNYSMFNAPTAEKTTDDKTEVAMPDNTSLYRTNQK